jgi:hypothetical protein
MKYGSGCVAFLLVFRLVYSEFKVNKMVLSSRGPLFLPKPNHYRLKLMSLLVPKVNLKLNLNILVMLNVLGVGDMDIMLWSVQTKELWWLEIMVISNLKVINLIVKACHQEDSDGYELALSVEESLVIRQILQVQVKKDEPNQQGENIFHMRCSVQTKVYWCEPRDHVVTQPTIKIEIWSRKAEIGLIGVWHNENLPQGTNTIGLSRMTPRSQLIFHKSDSVRSRTQECKNHSHMLKLKNSEVIIIKAAKILAYMSLNSSWKINPNRPYVDLYEVHSNLTQNPKLKSP